jgi:hypothetical protein
VVRLPHAESAEEAARRARRPPPERARQNDRVRLFGAPEARGTGVDAALGGARREGTAARLRHAQERPSRGSPKKGEPEVRPSDPRSEIRTHVPPNGGGRFSSNVPRGALPRYSAGGREQASRSIREKPANPARSSRSNAWAVIGSAGSTTQTSSPSRSKPRTYCRTAQVATLKRVGPRVCLRRGS